MAVCKENSFGWFPPGIEWLKICPLRLSICPCGLLRFSVCSLRFTADWECDKLFYVNEAALAEASQKILVGRKSS